MKKLIFIFIFFSCEKPVVKIINKEKTIFIPQLKKDTSVTVISYPPLPGGDPDKSN